MKDIDRCRKVQGPLRCVAAASRWWIRRARGAQWIMCRCHDHPVDEMDSNGVTIIEVSRTDAVVAAVMAS